MKAPKLIRETLVLVFGILAIVNISYAAPTNLPFPSLPASFEEAKYHSKKGCIQDDKRLQFAVMKNEGMIPAGVHPLMDSPEVGVHVMTLIYSPTKNYGYTLSNKNDGMQCIYNKLENMKFENDVADSLLKVDEATKITPSDCRFDSMAINLCGSYESVTARLIKAGYQFNWQGDLGKNFLLTMLSKDQQSFYLKTDLANGATIITSVGKGKYQPYDMSNPWSNSE